MCLDFRCFCVILGLFFDVGIVGGFSCFWAFSGFPVVLLRFLDWVWGIFGYFRYFAGFGFWVVGGFGFWVWWVLGFDVLFSNCVSGRLVVLRVLCVLGFGCAL